MYNYGLIVGRFHTFTKGHENLVNNALKVCKKVLIFVGSAQEHGTLKNPLKVETRIKIIKTIYKDNPNVIVVPLNDLTKERKDANNTKWGDYLLENARNILGENPDCMILGLASDEVVRINGWFDIDSIENINFLLVPRSSTSISGTEVRNFMINENINEWKKWTNERIHYMYNEIREELLNVQ